MNLPDDQVPAGNLPGVILATRHFWPLPGGWENVWSRLLSEWVRRGGRATVLTPTWQLDWPPETIQNGIRIVRLPAPSSGGHGEVRYLMRLRRALRQLRPTYDVAIVAGMRGDAYTVLGEVRPQGVPVVLVPERPGLAGDCHWQIEACCGARVKRRCYQADLFAAATPLIERELIAAGYARPRIKRLPIGVPIPTATTADARREARRSLAQADPALGLADGGRLVVYVGRLRMGKGLETLLAAWREVVAQDQHVKLWLVGEGPDTGAVRDRVIETGLVPTVRLTGAFDDVDDVYLAANVAVRPDLEDGPAIGLLEAASYGLPIVASDLSTHCDLLADGVEMLSYPRRDAAALTEALRRVLGEADLARTLGANVRVRTTADYALPRMADDLERLIGEATANRSMRSVAAGKQR